MSSKSVRQPGLYPAKYKDANGRQWEAFSGHPQVDSGLGFTCDEGVLDLVLAFNQRSLRTVSACQGPVGGWLVPRVEVGFVADTSENLFKFCVALREEFHSRYGELGVGDQPGFTYECTIRADNYFLPRTHIYANLSVPRESVCVLIDAVNTVMDLTAIKN